MEQQAILAVVLTPQKRVRGKQMQGEMANTVMGVKRRHVAVPEKKEHPIGPEMVEQAEDGGEMVKNEEEASDTEMVEGDKELLPGKARSGAYRWRQWTPCRVRSFFKRNPRGDTKGCEACRVCGVSRLLESHWYLSKKTNKPAGSWCKTCKVKRQLELRRSQDVD